VIGRLMDYIEIKTKLTSISAFLMTVAFLFYQKQKISWKLTLIFFAAMFLFDLATTAINNYIDTKTNQVPLQMKRNTALLIILILLAASTVLGIWLVYLTDLIVLLLGGFCFLCGILYTYGPVPISRQPLGEVFSGIFYGLLIPFILLYINMPEDTYFTLNLSMKTISVNLKVLPLITVLILSIVPASTTANIMLANNICDLEHDIRVKRHTLPYYLGKKAIYLYAALFYAAYSAIILMVILRILSPICLFTLLTVFPVQKNINRFLKLQDKKTTFITAIYNYMLIMGTLTLLIFLSGLIG